MWMYSVDGVDGSPAIRTSLGSGDVPEQREGRLGGKRALVGKGILHLVEA